MNKSDLPSKGSSRPGSQPDELEIRPVVANVTPNQFNFFVQLPLEIQLKIWEYICFIPRVVDVFSSGTGCEALHNLDDNFHNLFGGDLRVDFNATYCHPPTVLHVCQESRRAGLQFYTLAFGKGPFSANPPTSSNISFSCQINMPAHIYINWECDIVCPMGAQSRGRNDMEVQLLETLVSSAKELRHLAIDPIAVDIPVGTNLVDVVDFSDEEPELSWAHLLTECPKLEEIILYHLPNDCGLYGTTLELIDISEVEIEQGVGFKVPELKSVRDVILKLISGKETSRKVTDVREVSEAHEHWVPPVVRIMDVTTERK